MCSTQARSTAWRRKILSETLLEPLVGGDVDGAACAEGRGRALRAQRSITESERDALHLTGAGEREVSHVDLECRLEEGPLVPRDPGTADDSSAAAKDFVSSFT